MANNWPSGHTDGGPPPSPQQSTRRFGHQGVPGGEVARPPAAIPAATGKPTDYFSSVLGSWYLRANTNSDSVEVDLSTDPAYYMEPQSAYCPPMGGPTETSFLKMLAGEITQTPTVPAQG